jgi:S-DNA-T family DNA segregation ATPase FtsK/SpoIIIE
VLVALVLILWYRSSIAAWFGDVGHRTAELFGWGLLIVIIAFGILVSLVRFHKLRSIIHRWNRWLAGIALLAATWGILSFSGLGGSLGLAIIGSVSSIGALRLLGIIIIGVIFVKPGPFLHPVENFISWLRKHLKRQRAPKPKIDRESGFSPSTERSLEMQEPSEAETGKKPVIPISPGKQDSQQPAQTKQELRQIAQEVWKKYGESPNVVTVDGWRLPPVDILDVSPEVEFSQADNLQRAKLIEEALYSYGVEAKVVQINAGPTVTQFGVEPGWDRKTKEVKEKDKDGNVKIRTEEISKTRVKVERITSLANDLALSLAAPSIRIEAPVPGKSVVGVEVPNTVTSLVSLRGVIETSVFQKMKTKSKLCMALGKGAGGEAAAADLSRMPHLLIAGATGSGKTVCLNSIICCLLLYNTPYDIKFIMVDPKRVELTPFNSIPHLATPVIVDASKAVNTLRWLSQEMDRRYQKLASVGVRNIEGYNKGRQGSEKLPYLILIIDELADLMMTGFDEVERTLCRLAQLARAIGIHLIVATQRPSVDVVTGLIKANFPTRISFAVTSQVDSRTILDIGDAEKLLGRGDMLYLPTEAGKPKRLQGCFVSDPETERLVYFWSNQRKDEPASFKIDEVISGLATEKKMSLPEDPLLEAARQLMQEHKHISTSFLQRKLRIGYPRAARIMEQLGLEDVNEQVGPGADNEAPQ